ncbi:MAG TPA: DNA-binding domain-containing protein [Polyangiaceae bacterium]|nr:DNA-binding domain-containing protein [Polyangiaceae bacterium]
MKVRRASKSSALALQELQSWLLERVTEPRARGSRKPGAEVALEEQVVAGRLQPSARIEVYRHGYFARLVECLEDDYPALRYALGAARFEALCQDFIERHPPPSPSLNHYGAPFAAYCRTRSEAWGGFATELARLEWALVEAIHAEEGTRLEVAALARLSPEEWSRARLIPSPALRTLGFEYPVDEFYQRFVDRDDALEAPPDGVPLPAPEWSAVAVCRRAEVVWRLTLRASLARLLERLMAGAPLLPALEQLGSSADAGSATPEELQRAFQDWVSCGLFSAVSLGAP